MLVFLYKDKLNGKCFGNAVARAGGDYNSSVLSLAFGLSAGMECCPSFCGG